MLPGTVLAWVTPVALHGTDANFSSSCSSCCACSTWHGHRVCSDLSKSCSSCLSCQTTSMLNMDSVCAWVARVAWHLFSALPGRCLCVSCPSCFTLQRCRLFSSCSGYWHISISKLWVWFKESNYLKWIKSLKMWHKPMMLADIKQFIQKTWTFGLLPIGTTEPTFFCLFIWKYKPI